MKDLSPSALPASGPEERPGPDGDWFRQIADTAPAPMWAIRRDGRPAFVNRAYADFLGRGVEEALGFEWRSLLHPDDAERVHAEAAAGEASLQPFTIEARYLRHDGAWRWLRSVSRPWLGAGGEHIGFIGLALDLTDTKEVEHSLREREEQFSAFISQTAAGFGQVDLTGRFTLVNDRFCEITGYPREALLKLRMQEITHPDDLARNIPLFERAVAEGTPYVHEKRYIRPDGSIIWVNNSVSVIRRPDGQPYGVLAVTLDVSDRREAEASLREHEESLRLAIEGAGMATWDLNLETMEGRWSPNRFDMLGYPRPPVSRAPLSAWIERIHPDDIDRVRTTVRRCFEQGVPFHLEYRIFRADTGEERWLESHGSRIDAHDGRPARFVGVSFDITERKRADERQQLLINELNHRVKNMLAIVQGIARQSFRGETVPPVAREAFEGRMAALAEAHDLLTRAHWGRSSLLKLVGDAVAPYRGDDADRFSLAGPDVMVEPKTAIALALALHELSTNAVKHGALSVPGGRVSIHWQAGPPSGELRLLWVESGGPPVAPPSRRGFGTRMIERGLSAELGGAVTIDFAREGVRCSVVAPLVAPVAAE